MTVNPLTPWIEQLDNCRTDAERARWLLTAPYSQLMTYEFAIRNRLRLARFQLGINYLDGMLEFLRSERVVGIVLFTTACSDCRALLAAIASTET